MNFKWEKEKIIYKLEKAEKYLQKFMLNIKNNNKWLM